jgi:phosphocarrier protein FPr
LDIGGDKPLPYLDLGPEDNPFLGWRGIRFCLDQPHLFKPQLRAALRASAHGNVKLMFPMVGSISELRAAKALLDEEKKQLRQAGISFDEGLDVGIMIEVPSAVATADLLAAEVDFFSIGTNDLTQYTMAADRGNANVASLVQALQPAVLRLIKQTVDAAHEAGIWVGICGELAGDAKVAPLLVGLGLDELSMSAPSIPAVKTSIRRVALEEARSIAAEALAMDSAATVLGYLAQTV